MGIYGDERVAGCVADAIDLSLRQIQRNATIVNKENAYDKRRMLQLHRHHMVGLAQDARTPSPHLFYNLKPSQFGELLDLALDIPAREEKRGQERMALSSLR